jgi:hypothetical protein
MVKGLLGRHVTRLAPSSSLQLPLPLAMLMMLMLHPPNLPKIATNIHVTWDINCTAWCFWFVGDSVSLKFGLGNGIEENAEATIGS